MSHRLTLVSAPAGAGKTTLVSAWVLSERKKGIAFGWLSLDEADNDLGRFLEYLSGCLEEGGTVIDIPALPAGTARPASQEDLLSELIQGLMKLEREVILVLDDYHWIQNKEVHAALQYLLDHASPHLHFILLTRSDPPLELARLRVSGMLGELRMDQLRFSVEEAAEFLERTAGIQLADKEISALNTRTEGWIAGLQMAAISLQGVENIPGFIAAFTGSHRYVFDYLIEQVLNRQAPEVRDFLLKTSILERLSAPLCETVAGAKGRANDMLKSIERGNLFLVPLDDEQHWYRYHHLFSELLRLVLDRFHPGLSIELHHLACHWFEEHGLLAEALHHGLAAGDMELVTEIVSKNVLVLLENAEIIPLLAQFDSIPSAQRAGMPWLEVAHAWGLAHNAQNDRSRSTLDSAERQMSVLPEDKRVKMKGHIAAVRGYLAWTDGDFQQAITFSEEADRCLPEEDAAVRSMNLTTLGNALTEVDGGPRSQDIQEEAFQLARQAGQPHVIMLAASGLAYTYEILGKFHQALVVCKEAIAIGEAYQRQNSRTLTALACIYAPYARALLEIGRCAEAVKFVRKGLALSELWGQVDTIMICHLVLANVLSVCGQSRDSQTVLQNARRVAEKASPWHLANVEETELDYYLNSDPQDEAEIQKRMDRAKKHVQRLPGYVTARALLKLGRPEAALEILQDSIIEPGLIPDYKRVRILTLKALAQYQVRDYGKALSTLETVLTMAEPENQVTNFVREGAAMEKLLRMAQGKTARTKFVGQILKAMAARQADSEPPRVQEGLIEPLSERELEVLQQLNSYLSTPEIAERLVVSANTVRTHIKNIYAKLDAHGRSGAIKRAVELGLLA